jgi:hypothetical protein
MCAKTITQIKKSESPPLCVQVLHFRGERNIYVYTILNARSMAAFRGGYQPSFTP